MLQRIGQFITYLWLCRVALLALLALVLLGTFAGPDGLEALRSALSELSGKIAFFGALLAALAAAILTHSLLTTVTLAPQRFAVEPFPLPRSKRWGLLPLGATLTAVASLPLVVRLALSGDGTLPLAVLGALTATLVVGATLFVRRRLLDQLSVRPPRFLRHLRKLGPGYVCEDENGQWTVCKGHLLATLFAGVTALVYAVAWWRWRVTDELYQLGEGSAINYLLLWLILAATLLAGLSFLLDRVRFPLLIAVLLGSYLGGVIFLNFGFFRDHIFEVNETEATQRVSLDEFGQRFAPAVNTPTSPDAAPDDGSPAPTEGRAPGASEQAGQEVQSIFTFVSAEGGGIRAAAWTAQVLSGLTEDLAASQPSFLDSLTMISATSGGSVGSHFYLEGVREALASGVGNEPDAERLQGVVRAAEASSLDATAWGLVYPDFLRLFLGWRQDGRARDRGWALERAWQHQLEQWPSPVVASRLSDWAELARQGHGPMLVFNSTAAETGDPAWISNADFSQVAAVTHPGLYDMDLATAARLSATFPVVSPSARPRLQGDTVLTTHYIDGGYFDNTGDLAILHTLEHFRSRDTLTPNHRVLWIQIRDFQCESGASKAETSASESAGAQSSEAADTGETEDTTDGSTLGVIDTVLVPLRALANIRGSSQRIRGNFEAELFGQFDDPTTRALAGADGPTRECQGNWCRIRFQPVTKVGQCLPLSWALSPENKVEVGIAWDASQRERELVRGFFAGERTSSGS